MALNIELEDVNTYCIFKALLTRLLQKEKKLFCGTMKYPCGFKKNVSVLDEERLKW